LFANPRTVVVGHVVLDIPGSTVYGLLGCSDPLRERACRESMQIRI
jgi:hypothetical protein